MTPVTIYTTPSCGFCHLAKEFFQAHSVSYTEKDVARDATAREEMLNKSNQMGVPVIEIGDAIIVGFYREKIAELLGIQE
ncbi:MAG: glutaredoxin domain-containing protein [Patescibacteria group bacterium]